MTRYEISDETRSQGPEYSSILRLAQGYRNSSRNVAELFHVDSNDIDVGNFHRLTTAIERMRQNIADGALTEPFRECGPFEAYSEVG